MKAKVIIPFIDKHTGKSYKKGEIIDISPERFIEIEKPHYIQPTESAITEKKEIKENK